jgi:arsenical pump membrane protein
VLLTPVVLRTTQQLRVRTRPHLYACAHRGQLRITAPPVSNLTNLLAFAATGLSFGRFTALMALPWTVACLLDWGAVRWFFRADLTPNSEGRGGSAKSPSDPGPPRSRVAGGSVRGDGGQVPAAPRYPLMILAGTIAGFVVTSAIDVPPAWAAWLGVVALAVPALKARRTTWWRMVNRQALGSCSSSWHWA